MRTFPGKRDSMCRYTVRCDAGGVRTQQVLRQDGTVCQTAGAAAVVSDSRHAVAQWLRRRPVTWSLRRTPRCHVVVPGPLLTCLGSAALDCSTIGIWTCCGGRHHADGEVPASGGAAVVNVV